MRSLHGPRHHYVQDEVGSVSTNEKILRLPQVLDKVGLKKSAIYNRIKVGQFPPPIKLGTHASGWLESDVQNWILQQAGRMADKVEPPLAA